MKRTRSLYLVFPLGAAALVALGYALLGDRVTLPLLTLENLMAFAAASLGSAVVVRRLGRGDYLRTAWALMGACYALLFVDALLFGASTVARPRVLSDTGVLVSGALTVGANLATVVGLLWVGRAWRVAGLQLGVSRGVLWGSVLTVLALSLAVLGEPLLQHVRALGAGHFDALPGLGSALGDVVAASLLVPLLLTAISLRGGALAWPWGLLTAGIVAWLGFDGIELLGTALGASPATMLPVEEGLRVAACLLQLTAGLAQRDALDLVSPLSSA